MGFKNEKYEKAFYNFVAKNVQVNYNHTEIADLLSKNNLKYVFIKGVLHPLRITRILLLEPWAMLMF